MTTDSDDLVDALREENDVLRSRIAQLEGTIDEYRRQMADVLSSGSWRATAPLRNVAGRGRLLRRRVKELPERLRRRPVEGSPSTTVGLFPPDPPGPGGLVDARSPLFAQPHRQRGAAGAIRPRRPAAKVLVVAHVFYPEVWFDIEDRLVRIPEPFDLVVSLVEDHATGLEAEITSRLPNATIHHVPNYGRDLGPLVELANAGYFAGYDAILKVHTKRSPHRLDGDAWRVSLLDGVLPSPEAVGRMIELLRRDHTAGLIVPSGHVRGPETWGSDQPLVEALASRIPFSFDPDALRYAAGSMYWARPWVLARLADLGLSREHFESEAGHLDGSTSHALERFVGVMTQTSGLGIVETDDVPSRLQRARRRKANRPRVLAFYLPQFHRTPENDEWWGEGFTDWVNVSRARPLYEGHRQPVEPGDLGHYDLSQPATMRAQATLAAEYGVDGFVMYHYWFDGRPLLDAPLRNLLADPSIDFPFALCWANENWTRRWDGLDSAILIAQRYPAGWADRLYDDLLPALNDPRYIHVDGKPVLVVYRLGQVPNAPTVIEQWKERAERDGLGGLHVLAVANSRQFEELPQTTADAIDGLVQFPPLSGIELEPIGHLAPGRSPKHTGQIYSYDAAADGADLAALGTRGLPVHPGVMPGWDNTPRRGDAAYVFHGSNPLSFRRWLTRAVAAAPGGSDDRLVFVNAWNEWAEGAHLEPGSHFGCAFLEAVRDTVGPIEKMADQSSSHTRPLAASTGGGVAAR